MTQSILALIYSDSDAADDVLRAVAIQLAKNARRLAGLVQHNKPKPGGPRCDMILEDLSSGELIAISQDRGPHARGCSLVVEQLLSAMQLVRAALGDGVDLVILNKFGKTESEGGGFRTLIAETIDRGIPLLIATPYRNIESWRAFAGEFATEIALESCADPVATIVAQLTAPMSSIGRRPLSLPGAEAERARA